MKIQQFYTWAPHTENFEGHETLEEAIEYAKDYGDYGPRYVFELKEFFAGSSSEEANYEARMSRGTPR